MRKTIIKSSKTDGIAALCSRYSHYITVKMCAHVDDEYELMLNRCRPVLFPLLYSKCQTRVLARLRGENANCLKSSERERNNKTHVSRAPGLWTCLITPVQWTGLSAPALRLCLTTPALWLCLTTPALWLCLTAPALWLCFTAPALWLCLTTPALLTCPRPQPRGSVSRP